jgi:hypothetical protein
MDSLASSDIESLRKIAARRRGRRSSPVSSPSERVNKRQDLFIQTMAAIVVPRQDPNPLGEKDIAWVAGFAAFPVAVRFGRRAGAA